MQVWLYKRKYDKKYIHPDLGSHKVIDNCVFKERGSLDVVNPIVKFSGEGIDLISDMNGVNYMYIPQLRSYYWVKWYAENGIIVLEGERDPLYTFWGDIAKSTQYVIRQKNKQNRRLPDNRLALQVDNRYITLKLDNSIPVFDKHCTHLILETTGTGSKGSD